MAGDRDRVAAISHRSTNCHGKTRALTTMPRGPKGRSGPRRARLLPALSTRSPTRSRRCCETMIFVPSSFIRLSEPIARGTVIGQRTSRTRLRASCPTSRTSEHSRAGARRRDVRMFGCLSLDGPHRKAVCLPDCGRYLPLSKSYHLDAPFDRRRSDSA